MTTTFRIDLGGDPGLDARALAARAVTAEAEGYDGVGASETRHDPFLSLALAAQATERVELLSTIAVAFARSPMTVAQTAHDLQAISGGRFLLGLGSQVRAHIERRFSMPWSKPAARMAEFVEAVRAIWATWQTGAPLRFQGEFYSHTLMTPFFSPQPLEVPLPPIWIAAVGERMTETAGRVADGLHAHSFTTRDYLVDVSLPALRRGAEAAGRDAASVGVALPALVAVGDDGPSLDAAIRATRAQIAFYGSTPAYLPVLEAHGWTDLHERLHAASRRGEWDAMAELVPDDVLAAFAAVGSADEVAATLRSRFEGLVTRLSFSASYAIAPDTAAALLRGLRA
ncbi:TIGR03617 family F420-dependent LLM class oxidoreductase [Amnibacterium kyonggiense]|uniref:Putative F420-dependent oxidoreductase n=1 Tax=Amnibacterium kyonggiense TaxID=595671 RepID=A0A4R7FSL2_9MICO|nr:TIGR03617 family F420-dependent LLM class oxidoreductase [Amnibacterium kyonggiense]TDS80833.1 putative F420-dependent oxidoreductase [Amnibacterium kyonggiense]